jgi:hypothetical protein
MDRESTKNENRTDGSRGNDGGTARGTERTFDDGNLLALARSAPQTPKAPQARRDRPPEELSQVAMSRFFLAINGILTRPEGINGWHKFAGFSVKR